MKKIWLLSVAVYTLIMAETPHHDSHEALHESEKTSPSKEKSIVDMLELSLIVDGSYTTRTFDNKDEIGHLEIPGFLHGGHGEDDGHAHTPLDGNKGFTFNYAEIHFGSEIGEHIDFSGNFHITKDMFEVEELFGVTRGLPYGVNLKAGKFRSDFGYLNNKHEHSYNFFEIPLIYNVLLGYHAILEQGMQLQYVFPSSYYVMGGIEALRGENEQSFGYESFQAGINDVSYPALYVGYLKTSLDIAGGTLLAGLSLAKGDARMDHLEDKEEPQAFSGKTTLYGVDMRYKYHFSPDHAITLQSEYLYRKMDGTQYGDGFVILGDMSKKQAGYYTELVYQYDSFWKAGVRYSAITRNDILLNDIQSPLPDTIWITSAMVEYDFAEHSLIRMQYNHNSSLFDEEGHRNNKQEFIVQLTYMFGEDHEHEAHEMH